MEPEQRKKLETLLAGEHIALLVTQGDEWPTATMQAYAETPDLDLVFIMQEEADRFQNLRKRPHVAVFIDDRVRGDAATFRISRVSIQGIAAEVAPGGQEWDQLKSLFLAKNPFEARFFKLASLRMVRFKPRRVSYAGADYSTFKTQF
ncbi:MAG TPA: pyridoxamine 5'-phosphate oxidase family protein [Candidatus Binataceae bacterium]|nr:pyridoxamine 5'-phosphate oxidase family protein [Candidatus Binataceae bacterium]